MKLSYAQFPYFHCSEYLSGILHILVQFINLYNTLIPTTHSFQSLLELLLCLNKCNIKFKGHLLDYSYDPNRFSLAFQNESFYFLDFQFGNCIITLSRFDWKRNWLLWLKPELFITVIQWIWRISFGKKERQFIPFSRNKLHYLSYISLKELYIRLSFDYWLYWRWVYRFILRTSHFVDGNKIYGTTNGASSGSWQRST